MAQAKLDDNSVPAITGALNTDGATIIRIKADPTTHALITSDGATGSDLGPTNDLRDQNSRVCLMAVSDADGQTPVVLYVNSSGALLIDSS